MGYAEILANQLPEFINGTKLFSNVQRIQGDELDKIALNLDDIESQLSPLTATWSLSIWEKIFGLPVNEDDDINLRRGKILAQMANISPLTPVALERILYNFATDVDVQNVPGEYRFTVTFNVKDNFSATVNNITATVDKVKPAHLVYDILFGFKTNINVYTNYEQYDHDCHYCGTFLSGQYKL